MMEQRLHRPTPEHDAQLQAVTAQIAAITHEYSLGVSDVLAGHNVDDLIRVANDPYAPGGVFEAMSRDSLNFMGLLVPRFKVLYPEVHEDRITADAASAVETAEQMVIASKIFEKVASEIDGPTGLSDATCSNLARYNPGNQNVVIDMTQSLYAKYVADHKAGKDVRILRHNGEAFGHIGGDLAVTMADNEGGAKSISLDEYKILLLLNDRRDLRKRLAKRSDPDVAATLRAVEDIPMHAYQQQFKDIVEPTRLGKSFSSVGHGAQTLSAHAVRAALKTSQRVAVDHKKVVSTAALVGVAGTFGLSVIEPARAQAATTPRLGTSLYTANQASTFPKSAASEVDGGLVVMASPTAQLSSVKQQSQEINDGGIIITQEAAMVLPAAPLPISNILQIKNETVQKALTNAIANGDIMGGARALTNASGVQRIEVSTATPVHATIENLDAALAKTPGVPQKIVGEVRNRLIIASAALDDPDILNTISAEEWNVIQGGQDSAATQSAISQLTDKHAANLGRLNNGLKADSTPDQQRQLAELLASSEYYGAYETPSVIAPKVEQLAPVNSQKNSELPSGLPESAKLVTPEIVAKMLPNASQSTIDKNYGLIMKALASRGATEPTMALYTFATIGVETSTFKPIREWGRGAGRYRTSTGDYYGRGFIQLTWESNYRKAGKAIGIDLINNPDLALEPEIAAKIFAWYLTAGNHDERIRNALKAGDLAEARAVVNGGTNGLHRFSDAYNGGLKAVEAASPAIPSAPVPAPAPAPIPTTPTTPPETFLIPIDNGDGLVIAAQPSQQTPDSAENPTTPIDAPPVPQPPTDSPAPESSPTATAPDSNVETATGEAQRVAEIASLKASGQFNQSQASPDAPRSPLMKLYEQQGKENGKLDNIVELGPQWPNMKLAKPAAEAFLKLNDAFKAQFGSDIPLNDAYRDYDNQVAMKAKKTREGQPQFAATPGSSIHGWGLAFDGGGNFQSFTTAEYNWMLANGLDYGWNHPAFAAPGSNAPEPWQWEYVLGE